MRPDIVTLPSSVIASVVIVLVAAAIVAAFAMVRVTLTAESVSMSMEADSVAAQIDSARTLGNDLEVQQSRLANATIIRSQASRLGMAAPAATSVVTLDDDVVSTDSDGNLSLSGSIEAIAARG